MKIKKRAENLLYGSHIKSIQEYDLVIRELLNKLEIIDNNQKNAVRKIIRLEDELKQAKS